MPEHLKNPVMSGCDYSPHTKAISITVCNLEYNNSRELELWKGVGNDEIYYLSPGKRYAIEFRISREHLTPVSQ